MALFEKFGNMDTEELNMAAYGLKEEGDRESLKALAEENGIDPEDAIDYLDDIVPVLATPIMAAVGKLEVEAADLNIPKNILITDWIGYIRQQASEDEEIALTVRNKDKSLAECIGKIMAEAFANQWTVPAQVTKAASISASKVTFGIPSEAAVKKIIREYYGGQA